MSRSSAVLGPVGAVLLGGAVCLTAVASGPEVVRADEIQAQTVRLGWLDKVTARVGETAVPVGEELRLGGLAIIVRSCIRRVPPDDPESGAFLDIAELAEGEAPREIFRGWMFASSPALSSMDHGVYDVWVLECVIPQDDAAGESNAPDQPDDAEVVDPDLLPSGEEAPLD